MGSEYNEVQSFNETSSSYGLELSISTSDFTSGENMRIEFEYLGSSDVEISGPVKLEMDYYGVDEGSGKITDDDITDVTTDVISSGSSQYIQGWGCIEEFYNLSLEPELISFNTDFECSLWVTFEINPSYVIEPSVENLDFLQYEFCEANSSTEVCDVLSSKFKFEIDLGGTTMEEVVLHTIQESGKLLFCSDTFDIQGLDIENIPFKISIEEDICHEQIHLDNINFHAKQVDKPQFHFELRLFTRDPLDDYVNVDFRETINIEDCDCNANSPLPGLLRTLEGEEVLESDGYRDRDNILYLRTADFHNSNGYIPAILFPSRPDARRCIIENINRPFFYNLSSSYVWESSVLEYSADDYLCQFKKRFDIDDCGIYSDLTYSIGGSYDWGSDEIFVCNATDWGDLGLMHDDFIAIDCDDDDYVAIDWYIKQLYQVVVKDYDTIRHGVSYYSPYTEQDNRYSSYDVTKTYTDQGTQLELDWDNQKLTSPNLDGGTGEISFYGALTNKMPLDIEVNSSSGLAVGPIEGLRYRYSHLLSRCTSNPTTANIEDVVKFFVGDNTGSYWEDGGRVEPYFRGLEQEDKVKLVSRIMAIIEHESKGLAYYDESAQSRSSAENRMAKSDMVTSTSPSIMESPEYAALFYSDFYGLPFMSSEVKPTDFGLGQMSARWLSYEYRLAFNNGGTETDPPRTDAYILGSDINSILDRPWIEIASDWTKQVEAMISVLDDIYTRYVLCSSTVSCENGHSYYHQISNLSDIDFAPTTTTSAIPVEMSQLDYMTYIYHKGSSNGSHYWKVPSDDLSYWIDFINDDTDDDLGTDEPSPGVTVGSWKHAFYPDLIVSNFSFEKKDQLYGGALYLEAVRRIDYGL